MSAHSVLVLMPAEQYRDIAQERARKILSGSTDPPPTRIQELLRQRGINPEYWSEVVEHFGDWFHGAAGAPSALAKLLERTGRKWIRGIRRCRDVFR